MRRTVQVMTGAWGAAALWLERVAETEGYSILASCEAESMGRAYARLVEEFPAAGAAEVELCH